MICQQQNVERTLLVSLVPWYRVGHRMRDEEEWREWVREIVAKVGCEKLPCGIHGGGHTHQFKGGL
jgi:hypothetical protein